MSLSKIKMPFVIAQALNTKRDTLTTLEEIENHVRYLTTNASHSHFMTQMRSYLLRCKKEKGETRPLTNFDSTKNVDETETLSACAARDGKWLFDGIVEIITNYLDLNK